MLSLLTIADLTTVIFMAAGCLMGNLSLAKWSGLGFFILIILTAVYCDFFVNKDNNDE